MPPRPLRSARLRSCQELPNAEASGLVSDCRACTATWRPAPIPRSAGPSPTIARIGVQASPPSAHRTRATHRQDAPSGATVAPPRRLAWFGRRAHWQKSESTTASDFVLGMRTAGPTHMSAAMSLRSNSGPCRQKDELFDSSFLPVPCTDAPTERKALYFRGACHRAQPV